MMELHIDESALWKQRMRTPQIKRFVIARNNPEMGLITSNIDGKLKTYLWKPLFSVINSRPCLEEDYYVVFTPDGKYLHYFKDTKGNQQGHRWRMSVETGEHVDLTPDLPTYYAYRTTFSDDSKKFAFIASFAEISRVYLFDFDETGKLIGRKTLLDTTESIMLPRLSPDGKLFAFTSTENGDRETSSVLLLDADSGKMIKRHSAGIGSK
ncbi:MAG: hypothetical protein HGA95_03295, partial [Caldiserica bacterium]|nr:hypothetical protein [Caldisericota bacterium]